MRVISIVGACGIIVLLSLPYVASSQQEGPFSVSLVGVPQSLEQLTATSDLIVVASVVGVFPAVEIQGATRMARLETDALLQVTRVLKGSEHSSEIVVSQMGGVTANRKQVSNQFALMQPGESYILFLVRPSGSRVAVLPGRPGKTRYDIRGNHIGAVRMDGDRMQLSRDLPYSLRNKYDGVNPAQLINDVTDYARSINQ